MNSFAEYGPPFWNEATPQPPQNEYIGKYLMNSMFYSTNSSFYYLSLNTEDKQVKFMKFIKVIEEKILRIKDEIVTLQLAQHPNIIQIQDCFRFSAYLCIVFPYTPHLSLHQYLLNEYPKGFPEEIAASIFRQMLKAVEYLHSLNIWNRDIKLESFLVFDSDNTKDPNNNLNIVLSNFEYSKVFDEGMKGTQFLGTPEFMAPEMIKHVPYGKTVDIWSLGVSLFMLLTGQLPFPSYKDSPDECMNNISKGLLNYQLMEDKGISTSAIALIKNMCDIDPRQRISATDALMNTWIMENNIYLNTNETEKESKIADEFFKNKM